ncbi:hypothetical protein L249_0234 [Ophiocordyceps polyrhachis-furcata BCC 54312]|uniref:Rrn9 domain-containing protein n=1 Tax=Ophiocordyceps polyrhachis-furcata BCC 54312 TaxID=1330021 RepID=A0A367LFI5_9HYPO|nr:hypothetical protein L249_0234 [Ophiocordyceps polyrhachis-furcata BCC 54312]
MQNASEWDLDSSEIASVTSEDLHANRPNRWKGARSSWQTQMEEERQLHQAMKRVEGRDLATHLYNAATLQRKKKRRRMNLENSKREGEDGQEDQDQEGEDWAPPRIWTAWPTGEEILLPRREEGSLADEIVAAALRLARGRLRKRKCLFEEEDADAETETKTDTVDEDADAETPIPTREESRSAPPSSPLSDTCSSSSANQPVISADDDLSTHLLTPSKKLRRWRLRDWSDVLGAASLSGFPHKVIVNASARCASLFQENLVLRRFQQASSTSSTCTPPVTDFNIRPSAIKRWDEDFTVQNGKHPRSSLRQRRRLASIRANATSSSSSSSSSSATESRRRRRSSSARSSVSGLLFYCPVASCARAAEGFARRANLLRHLTSVHPERRRGASMDGADEDGEEDGGGGGGGDDDDDDVVDGVHVDGFLRPIRMAKGWRRAENM